MIGSSRSCNTPSTSTTSRLNPALSAFRPAKQERGFSASRRGADHHPVLLEPLIVVVASHEQAWAELFPVPVGELPAPERQVATFQIGQLVPMRAAAVVQP